MNKLAIAIAAAALSATPAFAQYAVGPQPYGGQYVRQTVPAPYGAPYAYAPGQEFGLSAPSDQFYGPVYSRERDAATEPDPNVQLELRREENLNEGTYNN